jgi:hypothetical protein
MFGIFPKIIAYVFTGGMLMFIAMLINYSYGVVSIQFFIYALVAFIIVLVL